MRSAVARFSEHTGVASPVGEAFAYVTDQDQVAEWNDHVQRVEVVGGGPVGVGTRLVQHRRRGSRDFDLTFQVTEHQAPTRHTVTGTVFGVDTTMDFAVAERGTGTRVTMTAMVTGKGVRALLAPVVAREMRKSTVAALAELRQRLGPAS
jgi:carbon monoxide dehydrogenase subunit G